MCFLVELIRKSKGSLFVFSKGKRCKSQDIFSIFEEVIRVRIYPGFSSEKLE